MLADKSAMKVHRLLTISFVIGLIWAMATPVQAESWPVKGSIDLSSGFGNFRNGHFHAGIDVRTGGRIGRHVFAPVDGYISRIRTSYYGYGKVVYLTGDNGNIYVFAHLDRFVGKHHDALRAAQKENRRYYQDIHFPRDSIRVSEGELIARAGQTGSGGPHLHFEKRSRNNLPINPLRHGFSLDDTTPPTISRIGFQMLDDTSMFIDGSRRFFVYAREHSGGTVHLDTVLTFDRPFGVMLDSYDRMRAGGMQQAVYRLTMYVDDELLYRATLDTVDYETGHEVFLEYDYREVAEERTRVRRLYKLPYDTYSGSQVFVGDDGAYGRTGRETFGRHTLRIVAEDAFGNSSELSLDFYWVPKEGIFELVDKEIIKVDTTRNATFTFVPRFDISQLAIDTVFPVVNAGDTWGNVSGAKTWFEGDTLRLQVTATYIYPAIMRLAVFTDVGGPIMSPIFNGLTGDGKPVRRIEHTITDRGIYFEVFCESNFGTDGRIELYHGDSLLGREDLMFVTEHYHTAFIPPQEKYRRIDLVGAIIERDTTFPPALFKGLDIYLVGLEDDESRDLDEVARLRLGKRNFFEPQYIEIIPSNPQTGSMMRLASPVYHILPKAFLTRENFELSVKLRGITPANELAGICWLDQKENRWVWLETQKSDDNWLTAESQGGGFFAAVYDVEPPLIHALNVRHRGQLRGDDQTIYFSIKDTLSGIHDDESIVLEIDGERIPVEYDPETGQCRAEPFGRLPQGERHLGIVVTDRAGNTTEQYLSFIVPAQRGSN